MIKGRIKLCPFCGGRGELVFIRAPSYLDPVFVVRCSRNLCAKSPECQTSQDAVDWWNRRHTGPQYPKARVKK